MPTRRAGRLVREDRQAAVDLHRVRGDQLGRDALRERLGDGRLARRGRAEDRENGVSHASRAAGAVELVLGQAGRSRR